MSGPVGFRTCVMAAAMAVLFTVFPLRSSEAGEALGRAKGYGKLSASVVKKVGIPKLYHEGLYHDGKSIWLCNGEGGRIWVIDTATGAVISEIEPVAKFTEAITAKGDGTFYTTEWYEKKVYRVRLDGNKLTVLSAVSVAPAHPAGVIWNGRRLYAVLWERTILGTKFSIVEMDEEMNVLEKVPVRIIQEPDHLAWDGAHLWMTSWYEKRVYKIDVLKWEAVGYFASPLEKTTGIAWDGSRLWLTATDGDLYQMEVAGQ